MLQALLTMFVGVLGFTVLFTVLFYAFKLMGGWGVVVLCGVALFITICYSFYDYNKYCMLREKIKKELTNDVHNKE